jgi:hypothetical protein
MDLPPPLGIKKENTILRKATFALDAVGRFGLPGRVDCFVALALRNNSRSERNKSAERETLFPVPRNCCETLAC